MSLLVSIFFCNLPLMRQKNFWITLPKWHEVSALIWAFNKRYYPFLLKWSGQNLNSIEVQISWYEVQCYPYWELSITCIKKNKNKLHWTTRVTKNFLNKVLRYGIKSNNETVAVNTEMLREEIRSHCVTLVTVYLPARRFPTLSSPYCTLLRPARVSFVTDSRNFRRVFVAIPCTRFLFDSEVQFAVTYGIVITTIKKAVNWLYVIL